MDVEDPQHYCRHSVEKVAPWLWSMQSVIMVWYLTAGQLSAQAEELRARLGPWDSEWSLRHMIQVLRSAIAHQAFDLNSADAGQLGVSVQTLVNMLLMAA